MLLYYIQGVKYGAFPLHTIILNSFIDFGIGKY